MIAMTTRRSIRVKPPRKEAIVGTVGAVDRSDARIRTSRNAIDRLWWSGRSLEPGTSRHRMGTSARR